MSRWVYHLPPLSLHHDSRAPLKHTAQRPYPHQEVSRTWGGALVPFFEASGYACAGGPYGNPFNGYMGVAVAWPRATMAVQEVNHGRPPVCVRLVLAHTLPFPRRVDVSFSRQNCI